MARRCARCARVGGWTIQHPADPEPGSRGWCGGPARGYKHPVFCRPCAEAYLEYLRQSEAEYPHPATPRMMARLEATLAATPKEV